MNVQTHCFKVYSLLAAQFSLFLFFLFTRAAAGQADSARPATLPPDCQASLRFLQQKVAAGAIVNRAHQAHFQVLVTDANGKPQAGVPVPLPVVVRGGQGKVEGIIMARVEWEGASQPDGTAVTDEKGIARGMLTSGNCEEITTLRLPIQSDGGPQASIQQVWNEEEKEKRWGDEEYGDEGMRVVYEMRYQRGTSMVGDERETLWEPITGHRMRIELTGVTLGVWNPAKGADEDGDGQADGEMKEKVSRKDADQAAWEYYHKCIKVAPVRETEPGHYTITATYEIPKDEAGMDLFRIEYCSFNILDDDAGALNGGEDVD